MNAEPRCYTHGFTSWQPIGADMRLAPLVVAATMAAGCASGPTPLAQPGAGDTVRLTFGWRSGDTAQVTELRVRRLEMGGETQENRFEAEWRMEVEEARTGVMVRTRDHKVHGSANNPALAELTRQIGELGRLMVSPEGKLVEIRGLDAVDATLEAWAAKTFAGQLPPRFLDQLSAMFEVDTIRMREEESWRQLVGFWSGTELEMDRMYGPSGPDLSAIRFRAAGHAPCHDGKDAPLCIRLEASSSIAGRELDQAVESAVTAIRAQIPEAGMRYTSSAERISILAEPHTLKPWRFERHREVGLEVEIDEDGNEIPAQRSEAVVRHIRWAQAR